MRHQIIRRSRIVAAIAATSLGMTLGFAVHAQDEADDETSTDLGKLVVTGSKLPRAGFDTVLPATVVTSEFIEDRGITNAADVLNELPAFGLPGNSTQGDQGSFGIGQNFVNFYGLGSQRTLTLVNGRRFVSSNSPNLFGNASAGLQVDLNVIPATLIDRIETVSVGGAPIYGADAIAGTVNVILKKDFEGFQVGTTYGETLHDSDLAEQTVNILYGANFDRGRGNFVFGFERNDRDGLIESDRDHLQAGWQFREPPAGSDSPFTRVLVRDAHANIVAPGGALTPGSTLLPNRGVGAWDGNFLQFAPDGSIVPYNVGSPTGNAVWSIGGDGIFLPDLTSLFTPYDRTLVTSFLNYEWTPEINAFGEFYYANTNAKELVNQPAYQSGFFGEEAFALNFQSDHPLLTPEARQTLTDLGADDFWIHRASTDLGSGAIEDELNLWRAVAGLQGYLPVFGRELNWDVSYIRGKSDMVTRSSDLSNERFFYALDVVDVGNGPQCRVVADPSSRPADPGAPFGTTLSQNVYDSCVPLDIFGQGRASPEALAYIGALSVAKTEIEQEVYSANANIPAFTLPAGDVQVGVGYEHRVESAAFAVDGFTAHGLGRSVPIEATAGRYTTDEYYAEFRLPVISPDMDIPFARAAVIEAAYRSVDNSFAGKDDIYTIGGQFAPIDDVQIRGNITRSVRAPAITELFLPLSGTFSFANDPCDSRYVDEGPSPATRRANCVADGINDPDNFTSNVANASVQGRAGGNRNLSNEVADAWTVGFVLRPRWVEDLTVAIDWVEFDIEDSIEQFTLQQVMESCYDDASFPNSFCSQFTREADGQLPAVNAFTTGFVNAGKKTFRGLTVDSEYSLDLADVDWIRNMMPSVGKLRTSAFLFFPREDLTIVGTSIDDDQGEPGNSDVQAQLNFQYLHGPWRSLLQSRYIGKATINNNDVATSRDVRELDAVWLFNAGVSYQVTSKVGVQMNINNLFDDTPEAAAIASGNDGVYDNIGRYVRLGLRAEF